MAIQKISNAVLGTGSVNATSIATGGVTLGDIPDAEITLAKLHTDVQTPINAVAGKQATIVSGTHIKTINSVSIVGSGNIDIVEGGPSLGTDSIIRTNADTISENITIPANTNGMTAGPVTIADGYTVTLNGTWSIV